MNEALLEQGIRYGEDLLLNRNNHLQVDKMMIRKHFELDGHRILDFGCGTGGFAIWLTKQWKCEVVGIDIDQNHILIANNLKAKYQINNVNFYNQNIINNPPSGQFDAIFLTDVIEHIPQQLILPIFRQLEKNLKTGGKVYISYPPWEGPYASHVTQLLKIPWCQYLPQSLLLKLIARRDRPLEGSEVTNYSEAYKTLNKINHPMLARKISLSPFEIVWRKSHVLFNKYKYLERINFNIGPLKYLVTKEFLILKKR